MADQRELKEEEVIALRKRVEYEDQLLNSRTAIVLTLNGLMAQGIKGVRNLFRRPLKHDFKAF